MLGVVPLQQAESRLENQINLDAIFFECAGDNSAGLSSLLDNLVLQSNGPRPPVIISTTLDEVNQFASFLYDERAVLLCDPTIADRVVALNLALANEVAHFHDRVPDIESVRLQRIADEVGRIAKALSNLSSPDFPSTSQNAVNDMMIGFRAEPSQPVPPLAGPSAAEIRTVIRMRRLRDQFFDTELFADPAWDMLLDLFAARAEQAQVAVSSLCIASAVPPTTALRWIKTMTDTGLLERIADPDDGRRIFIRLADHAAAQLARYWKAARQLGGQLV